MNFNRWQSVNALHSSSLRWCENFYFPFHEIQDRNFSLDIDSEVKRERKLEFKQFFYFFFDVILHFQGGIPSKVRFVEAKVTRTPTPVPHWRNGRAGPKCDVLNTISYKRIQRIENLSPKDNKLMLILR